MQHTPMRDAPVRDTAARHPILPARAAGPAVTPADPPHGGTLRPASRVMRLDRLGALRPTRLSFAPQLLRRIRAGGWQVERRLWSMDAEGVGTAVHVVHAPVRRYALVTASRGPDIDLVLFDGDPDPADVARIVAALAQAAPARMTERDLCVATARRDARLWSHVVTRLAAGAQPDPAVLAQGGALICAGALLASGMAGTADADLIAERPEMHAPFQAELLTLWLARIAARELAEHVARARGGARAVTLDEQSAAALEIGLDVGLGLAAFPVTRPCLFNTWIMAREHAIARVVDLDRADPADWAMVARLIEGLGDAALAPLVARMATGPAPHRPWAEVLDWAADMLPPAAQEALASAMLDPHGGLIDGLGHCMSDTLDRDYRIDGSMPVGRVRDLIARVHGWALERDWSAVSMTALAWSMTGDEVEPRLAPRDSGPSGPFELPLAVVHDAVRAWRTLGLFADETPVAQVLLEHPEHRSAIRRAQIAGFAPYAEIRENLIDADMRPMLLIRAMLAFMGADGVRPTSERGMRAGFFAGSPCPAPWNGTR